MIPTRTCDCDVVPVPVGPLTRLQADFLLKTWSDLFQNGHPLLRS